MKIMYIGEKTPIEVEFYDNGNWVALVGTTKINLNGFYLIDDEGEVIKSYDDFTTLYNKNHEAVMYSNDGSVWVEPIPVPPDPTPTLEERINDLEIAICEIADALGAME